MGFNTPALVHMCAPSGDAPARGFFEPSLVPNCQRINIGFRPEMADILIKVQGTKELVVTDPWVVYLRPPRPELWGRLLIHDDECIIRAEVEAINLGKRYVSYFTLLNKGNKLEDVEIIPLKLKNL